MNITVDTAAAVPPFEQIRQQLEDLIVGGQLGDQAKLPTTRQLASDLGVAVGTVARAYAELKSAQLISTHRAKGTRVCSRSRIDPEVALAADAFIAEAIKHGLPVSGMLAMIRTRASAHA